ncbi:MULTISPECIES: hypothetical protein [unclassified Bradyrhizobium]|uniref:hypothetical protein n=1 Tax=unclassified Bradyrhizobium TaxID=2631580 RepID=UPI0029163C02|nr:MULTISPECIES: hypothetical protein [unclassified Bradyrhizobium]
MKRSKGLKSLSGGCGPNNAPIRSDLNYLDEVDPASARVAGERYGCLTPWQRNPATPFGV